MNKKIGQFLVLFVLLLAIALIWWFRPEQKAELRTLAATHVVTGYARRVDLAPIEKVSGYLRPVRKATLPFEVSGPVTFRHVEPGALVEAGQVLLEIDAGDYRDAVTQATAKYVEIKDSLVRDKRLLELSIESRKLQGQEVKRLTSLKKRSLVSPSKIGDARALLSTRLAEEARLQSSVSNGPQFVAASKAALDSAKRNLRRTTLKAPWDGKVNQVFVNVGDYAQASSRAIELVDAQLEFYAQVRGGIARALNLGDSVTVRVDEKQHRASVVALQPDPDQTTFTHAIRLRLPADEIRSGLSAVAEMPLQRRGDVLVVPVEAVIQEDGHAYLFLVSSDDNGDSLQKTEVVAGQRFDQQLIIVDGLTEDSMIVLRDVAALAGGQSVIADKEQ
ncbi:MAG: efflux RND transporter periplasmic adaptor subunit [Gammaproteobacteria bacterium]